MSVHKWIHDRRMGLSNSTYLYSTANFDPIFTPIFTAILGPAGIGFSAATAAAFAPVASAIATSPIGGIVVR